MKKSYIMVLLSVALSCVVLAGCETEHTSSSNVTITTTDENGTKEYNYTAENNNGVVTEESTVTETPAENDSIHYEVDPETGIMTVTAPSNDDFWFEVYGDTYSISLDHWDVEDDVYTAQCSSVIDEGTAYVILAGYDTEYIDPYEYVIIPVNVEGGKLGTIQSDAIIVDDLAEYFGDQYATESISSSDGVYSAYLLKSYKDKIGTADENGILYAIIYDSSIDGNTLSVSGNLNYSPSLDQKPIANLEDGKSLFPVDDKTVYQMVGGEDGPETVTKEEFAGYLDTLDDSGLWLDIQVTDDMVTLVQLSA